MTEREAARELLLVYAMSGIPVSPARAEALLAAAQPDPEFEALMASAGEAREEREREHAADMESLSARLAAVAAHLRELGFADGSDEGER